MSLNDVAFHLTKYARRVLSNLDTPNVTATIRFQKHCIPLATDDAQLPAGLALPGGLQWNTAPVPVRRILDAPSKPPPSDLLPLQFSCVLCVSASDFNSVLTHLAQADMITVDGKPLAARKLCEVVTASPMHHPHQVKLYTSGKHISTDNSLSFNTTTAPHPHVMAKIDCLTYCSSDATQEQVLRLVTTSVNRVLTQSFAISDKAAVSISHFPVLAAGFALTVVTPEHEDEDSAESISRRRAMHNLFMLPTDRPMLRRSCRAFSDAQQFTNGGCPGRLQDVHNGIKSHGLGDEQVSVHLTEGAYLYCHYMQDKFNDSGWGCAYRSLQTILSWCAFERYVQFENGQLPNHKQIQQALVDVGDKRASFVSSKEWIGANEVCYVLEKLTGISSKILHVSSGAEMESKGRELARHFDTQGSPVMVGGGVLAWTILGVARDSRTADTRFLILDPHYEGRDELKVIQNKGWIGWRSGDAFVQKAFYNMCLPQRPSTV